MVADTWVSMGQEDGYAKRVAHGPKAHGPHRSPRRRFALLASPPRRSGRRSLLQSQIGNRMWTVMTVMAAQLGRI
jgi:hypothetical protein